MGPNQAVFYDEEVAAGAFGDEVFVLAELDGSVDAFVVGGLFGKDVAEEVEALDIAAKPADVFTSNAAHAGFLLSSIGGRFVDGHGEIGDDLVRESMGAFGGATGKLEIDSTVFDAAFLDEVVVDGGEFFVHVGDGDAQFAHGTAAAGQMTV